MTMPIPADHPEPPRPRRLRKFLRRSLGTIAVVAFVFVGFHFYSQQQRDSLLRKLEASGERLRWTERADEIIAQSGDLAGTKKLRETLAEFDKLRIGKSLLPTAGTFNLVAQKNEWRPGVYPEVQRELKMAAPVLAGFREAAKTPVGLIVPNAEFREASVKSPLTTHLSQVSRLFSLLALERVDALGRKDARKAYETVRVSLEATQVLAFEPLLASQERRAEVFEFSVRQLMHCLGAAAPTEDEYRDLDALFEPRVPQVGGAEIGAEMAKRLTVLDDPVLFRDAVEKFLAKKFYSDESDRWIEEWKYRSLASPLAKPLLFRVQTELLRDFDVHKNSTGVASHFDAAVGKRAPYETVMNVLFVSGRAERLDDRHDFAVSLKRSALLGRWGLRICRHYDLNNKLPGRFDDMKENGTRIDMSPSNLDAFAGKPPIYTPTEDGFTLEAGSRMPRHASLSSADDVVRVKFLPNRLRPTN
jgi:hypothetical protein